MIIFCIICGRPTRTGNLCLACCRSYDRTIAKDSTTGGIIEWCAARVWKIARDRMRERPEGADH